MPEYSFANWYTFWYAVDVLQGISPSLEGCKCLQCDHGAETSEVEDSFLHLRQEGANVLHVLAAEYGIARRVLEQHEQNLQT